MPARTEGRIFLRFQSYRQMFISFQSFQSIIVHEKQAIANKKRAAETMTQTLGRGQVFPRELIPFPHGPLGITLEANLPIPSGQCVSRPGCDSAGVR